MIQQAYVYSRGALDNLLNKELEHIKNVSRNNNKNFINNYLK